MYVYILYICIYIYIYESQIVHHNPCFNLVILHYNSFDNQGSAINKNHIFFEFPHLCFNVALVLGFARN